MSLLVLCSFAKVRKVLFIGDSITDGAWGKPALWNTSSKDRNHTDMNHIYGHGYMEQCAGYFQGKYPEVCFEFYNRGISGNTLYDLKNRWQEDVVDVHPDVVSILIGTNDVDRFLDDKYNCKDSIITDVSALQFDSIRWENTFRALLDSTVKSIPNVQFVLCTPFVAEVGKLSRTKTYPERKRLIRMLVKKIFHIAHDYRARIVPFNKLFDNLLSNDDTPTSQYWIWDGIHPTPAGHYQMSQMWIKCCENMLLSNE